MRGSRARERDELTVNSTSQFRAWPSATPMIAPRVVPSPRAAIVSWVSLVIVLNLTVHPVIAAASWVGLAMCAWVTSQRRLIWISLVVGIGMLAVIPGLSVAQGGLRLSVGDVGGPWPTLSVTGIAMAIASTLRVPAQVLAFGLVLAVPTRQLVTALSVRSHRSALLAGLVVRLRPLLHRDARRIRDELAALGVIDLRSRSFGARLGELRAVWESLIMTLFDRAESTTSVLDARGYGPSIRPTSASLQHPLLRDETCTSRGLDAVMIGAGLVACVLTVWARSIGVLSPPVITVFSGVGEATDVIVLVIALLCAAVGAAPARWTLRGVEHATRVPVDGVGETPYADLGVTAASSGGRDDVVVSVSNVQVRYPSAEPADAAPVLAIPSLSVYRGEFVLLAGASGSGKSTLLHAITASSGAARVVGVDGRLVVSSLRTGVVFQDPDQQVVLDVVAEDVAHALRADGESVAEIEQRVLAALHQLGCVHLARRTCSTLSGGELQRVALAGVVARRPDLVVLDEPTAMLDPDARRELWAVLAQLREQCGCAVIVAEHDVEHVLDVADRVVILDAGRVCWDGVAADAYPQLVKFRCCAPSIRPVHATRRYPRLVVSNLRVSAPDGRVIIRGLSMSLAGGAVVALTGANGVGKSTLLRAVRGLVPAEGSMWFDGVPWVPSVGCVSWVSQASSLVLGSTVAEHAQRVLSASGSVVSVDAVLRDAGLEHVAGSHPADISIGERQRLAIAATCAGTAPVWLLDEPSRGLDAAGRAWLAARIRAFSRVGGIVLMATHDAWLVASCASHVLRLGDAFEPSVASVHDVSVTDTARIAEPVIGSCGVGGEL